MNISELSIDEIASRLRQGNFLLSTPPFVVRIKSDIPAIARDIKLVYADFEVRDAAEFADFHVDVSFGAGPRRWLKPQVHFSFDGQRSFTPLPAYQAFPMLEWGINWCIAAHAHEKLVVHAAVVERNGWAAILPAPPGSGKSTLCAGLISRGWRLLTDELALYDIEQGMLFGMARPVNLKNRSIDVIKNYAPAAILTSPVADTNKGTVALMRPPSASVANVLRPARPRWVILPKYLADSPPILRSNKKAATFMLIAEQSFNYEIHGYRGFQAVGQLLNDCECYEFTYSKLDDAVRIFDELLSGAGQ